MDEQAIRIRLEGALERVERATERLERAGALMLGDWRHRAGAQLGLFEQVRQGDADAEATAARVAALGEKERWPPTSAPALALERYRSARRQLDLRARRVLPPQPEADLDAVLAVVQKEALPPAGPPLMRARVRRLDGSALVPAMIVTGTSLACSSAISTAIGGACVAVGAAIGLVLALPWLLSGGAVVLFADRVRHQTRFRGRELPHQPNLLTAQSELEDGVMQTKLLAPGWRPLRSDRSQAEDLCALSSLLGRPPFEPPFAPVPDGVCVRATRPDATPGYTLEERGALWLGVDGALFILDGAPTYDAATQAPGRGPNARARALGVALSALTADRSGPIVERLIAAGRAERLDPRTLELAKVGSTSLTIGQVRARFDRSQRSEVMLRVGKKRA